MSKFTHVHWLLHNSAGTAVQKGFPTSPQLRTALTLELEDTLYMHIRDLVYTAITGL
jgi:hypothetical protein